MFVQVNMLRERNKSYGTIKFVDISSKDYSPDDNQGLDYETVRITPIYRFHFVFVSAVYVFSWMNSPSHVWFPKCYVPKPHKLLATHIDNISNLWHALKFAKKFSTCTEMDFDLSFLWLKCVLLNFSRLPFCTMHCYDTSATYVCKFFMVLRMLISVLLCSKKSGKQSLLTIEACWGPDVSHTNYTATYNSVFQRASSTNLQWSLVEPRFSASFMFCGWIEKCRRSWSIMWFCLSFLN